MGRDARRTFLVLADDVDLFAALRPSLDSEMLQVTWARPAAVGGTLAEIAPWPWAVAGTGPSCPGAAVGLLSGRPILWFWLGVPPAGLPAHTRAHLTWRALATDTLECLGRSVGGVRLAHNRGLIGPRADLIISAELEGLVANAPQPMRLRRRALAPAERVLQRLNIPLSLEWRDGSVRLVDR